MKILHVINSLGSGGAEKLVVDMSNHLSKEGYEVGVFTFVSENNFFEHKLSKEICYYKNENKKYFSLKKIVRLYKTIKQYDVIHAHLFPSFYIVAFLSFLVRNKKFVYTEHNTHNNRRKAKYHLLEKIIYSRYMAITSISIGVKRALEKWVPIKKSVLINNFVKVNEIKNVEPLMRSTIKLSDADEIIVMIGSFSNNQKDQNTIIRSLKHLPTKFKLLLIGDGVLRLDSERYAESIGVNGRVCFLGTRKDVYNILKACDYGVLSSNWEGFGIVALEYMACGLPAIGTNVEGLNEVITEKESLFEVADDKHLANIILSLYSDKNLKESIVKRQQTRLKEYDINIIMNKMIELYKSQFS